MKILRKKDNKTKEFSYVDEKNKVITDKKILDYIENLPAIPPAYDNVVIFYEKSPQIIFQGYDSKGRLQQIYSPKWRQRADQEKFKHLIEFGKKLPKITMDILKHIKNPDNSKDKAISIIIRIITLCGFRIGHVKYQKLYNSTGLSTLQKKHISFGKDAVEIKFIGKKGVLNECSITDPMIIVELEKLVKAKKGDDHVFTYKENNEQKTITAIDVNNWLKNYNPDFTSKFFRIYNSNDAIISMTKAIKPTELTENQRKKIITEIIKEVSCLINNTPAICKKSYIDPNLLNLFIEQPKKYERDIINNDYTSRVNFIKFLERTYS